jgi:repressor LexA
MTDENEVTLKRFYKEKDHIRLQPENDEMAPIIVTNCTILGKAIGLYRKIK